MEDHYEHTKNIDIMDIREWRFSEYNLNSLWLRKYEALAQTFFIHYISPSDWSIEEKKNPIIERYNNLFDIEVRKFNIITALIVQKKHFDALYDKHVINTMFIHKKYSQRKLDQYKECMKIVRDDEYRHMYVQYSGLNIHELLHEWQEKEHLYNVQARERRRVLYNATNREKSSREIRANRGCLIPDPTEYLITSRNHLRTFVSEGYMLPRSTTRNEARQIIELEFDRVE